jgi:hypothetical protein
MSFKSAFCTLIAFAAFSSSIFSMELSSNNQNSTRTSSQARYIKSKRQKQLIAQASHPLARFKLRNAIALAQSREKKRMITLASYRDRTVNPGESKSKTEFSSHLTHQKALLNAAQNNQRPGSLNRPNQLKKIGRTERFETLPGFSRPATPPLPDLGK